MVLASLPTCVPCSSENDVGRVRANGSEIWKPCRALEPANGCSRVHRITRLLHNSVVDAPPAATSCKSSRPSS